MPGKKIQARKLAERIEKASIYRGLLEAAPDAMVVIEGGGAIVLLNAQVQNLFGYTHEELLGEPIEVLIPLRFRGAHPGHRGGFFAAPRVRTMGFSADLFGLRKDGLEFPIDIMLSPMASAEGMLVTAAIRDISVRNNAEQHLVKTLEDLKRSNEELKHFAYVASHDLQEPLRMVASFTQLLAKRYRGHLDADADEFIDFAVDGCERMQQMIADLLVYSQAGSKAIGLEAISSELAFDAAVADLRSLIEASGARVTHDALPEITTGGAQLTQVFRALIGNALKFHGAAPPHIHVSAKGDGDKEWIFSVRDNGLGIESQYFERIFLLFQRLHPREDYAGSGAGLALCKKLLERLGGKIWLESQLDAGSTFYFSLPAGAA